MKPRQLVIFAIATVLIVVSFNSFAGAVMKAPVEVDLVNRVAKGSQLAARTAKNKVEVIGCGVWGIADGLGGGYGFGFCQATDADGVSAACETDNEILLDVIKSVSAYSFIQFGWNEDGTCRAIKESNQSWYLPRNRRR